MSLVFLVVWIGFEGYEANGLLLQELIFTGILICSLALHELAHTLTASFLRIKTSEIILFPFGGIAAYDKNISPKIQIVLALAGPLINGLAAFLLFILGLTLHIDPYLENLLRRTVITNTFLAGINLLPIIPLDGGKIFRSILKLLKKEKATRYSIQLSLMLGIGLFALSFIFRNLVLSIFSAILLTCIIKEYIHHKQKSVAAQFKVADIMINSQCVQILQHGMTLIEALNIVFRSFQQHFPILHGSKLIGVVNRDAVIQAVAMDQEEYLSGVMSRDFLAIPMDTLLSDVLDKIGSRGDTVIVILEDSQFKGILTREKLLEFLFLSNIHSSLTEDKASNDRG
jgi:Zn-dependent protease/predicted transcriptional regulator